ncbi:FAD-dependent oxidoreductase [Paenibacillus nasutitermitis]|uniref:FAD-dependent oxidoreductase n=1 Tax=Paenibacillus nasutitermitis TaxID=1652958 RepID=A0A917DKU2_9BACL|nr:FAD-dependent oxidoreductase [Paenibacillus nasutitermitis]GGD47026.1 hypothetical protein GCM10010911_00700 [Paenibacillus nasutitermitis]
MNGTTYDAIVIGGGITGASAARTIASEGLRVALIEPTGTLGREITRAYNNFARLTEYVEQSPSIYEFMNELKSRKGWFEGQLDPTVAALALDEWLASYPVDVYFHVWPSRLLTDRRRVTGLEAASKSGRASISASRVIDASRHGKIARTKFASVKPNHELSLIHLIYNGISGPCPQELSIDLPGEGKIQVSCRPTFWKNEWRVTLVVHRMMEREDWLLLLDGLLPVLHVRIPELRSGVLAYLADDGWSVPDAWLSPARASSDSASGTGIIAGSIISPDVDGIVDVPASMLRNAEAADGLYLAGPWLEGYPFDPRQEELAIVNAFLLGDMVGRMAAGR